MNSGFGLVVVPEQGLFPRPEVGRWLRGPILLSP